VEGRTSFPGRDILPVVFYFTSADFFHRVGVYYIQFARDGCHCLLLKAIIARPFQSQNADSNTIHAAGL
jgi:hypothetical protein